MATDPQSLLDSTKCYACYGQPKLIKLGLLKTIALQLNSSLDTSPQALLTSVTCLQCYSSNPMMLRMIKLALLRTLLP